MDKHFYFVWFFSSVKSVICIGEGAGANIIARFAVRMWKMTSFDVSFLIPQNLMLNYRFTFFLICMVCLLFY